jgi:hypothetical protein
MTDGRGAPGAAAALPSPAQDEGTGDMRDVEPIREALRIQPFRPFELKLVDGSVFTVEHPDWITIPPVARPRELWLFVVRGSGDDEEYRTHWIDPGLISQVIVPGRAEVRRAPASAEGEDG